MILLFLILRTCTRPIVLDTKRLRGSGHGSRSSHVPFNIHYLSPNFSDMPCSMVNERYTQFPCISVFVVTSRFSLGTASPPRDNPDVIMCLIGSLPQSELCCLLAHFANVAHILNLKVCMC